MNRHSLSVSFLKFNIAVFVFINAAMASQAKADICSTVRGEEKTFIRVEEKDNGEIAVHFINQAKGSSFQISPQVGEKRDLVLDREHLEGLLTYEKQSAAGNGFLSTLAIAGSGLFTGAAVSTGFYYLKGLSLLGKMFWPVSLVMAGVSAGVYYSSLNPLPSIQRVRALALLKESLDGQRKGSMASCTAYTDIGMQNLEVALRTGFEDLSKVKVKLQDRPVKELDINEMDPSIMTSRESGAGTRTGQKVSGK